MKSYLFHRFFIKQNNCTNRILFVCLFIFIHLLTMLEFEVAIENCFLNVFETLLTTRLLSDYFITPTEKTTKS